MYSRCTKARALPKYTSLSRQLDDDGAFSRYSSYAQLASRPTECHFCHFCRTGPAQEQDQSSHTSHAHTVTNPRSPRDLHPAVPSALIVCFVPHMTCTYSPLCSHLLERVLGWRSCFVRGWATSPKQTKHVLVPKWAARMCMRLLISADVCGLSKACVTTSKPSSLTGGSHD